MRRPRYISEAEQARRERAAKRIPPVVYLEGPIPSDRYNWKTIAQGSWNEREQTYCKRLCQAPSGALYVWEASFMGWHCHLVALA